ncbi:MAG: haloacid dehalogenase-like hydrolase [Acidobacteria bacterium]|nr:haloacid dehalogenase-like hydrolase [Acidobacteriota bacterium]
MLIGVDFDNTIACYDVVFHRAASERGLLTPEIPAEKEAVRNHLRRIGREEAWTELQGEVYGRRMHEVLPFPGVLEFFACCRGRGVSVWIISHKTRQPYAGPACDLHCVALDWLAFHGFTELARIVFELTKERKLERIREARCTHFVDDLPEFLCDPEFPAGVQRILFDPHRRNPGSSCFRQAVSWPELEHLLFNSDNARLG